MLHLSDKVCRKVACAVFMKMTDVHYVTLIVKLLIICALYISINKGCYTYRSYFEKRAHVCVSEGARHMGGGGGGGRRSCSLLRIDV
jgi:hypothetical protein